MARPGIVRREVLGWMMALFGASAAAVAEAPGVNLDNGLMGNNELRAWVIMGSVLGAMVQVFYKPPVSMRDSALKFLCSMTTSFLTVPAAFRFYGWPTHVEYVLFSAGLTAFCAWSLLRLVSKRLPRWIEAKFGKEERED